MTRPSDQFPTDAAGLPKTRSSELFELGNGDQFDLRIAPVAKQLGGGIVRMLAYNGSIPGQTLRVQQGSKRSRSPTPACGWPIATSPSTMRAA